MKIISIENDSNNSRIKGIITIAEMRREEVSNANVKK